MQFVIHYRGREMMIDIIKWESTMDSRIEFYAVFKEQKETFVNFVKRTGQASITEVSSSADLPTDVKAVIKEKLLYYLQHLGQ